MPRISQILCTAGRAGSEREGSSYTWFWIPASLLLAYVLIKNYEFFESGLLDPDFEMIHQAFDFNFGLLPCLLSVLGFLCALFKYLRGTRSGLASLLFFFIALDLVALRVYMTQVEPFRLKVREVQILTPKLKKPIRIVHLSDIQAGSITKYERQLFQRIADLKPDILINTGDYLQIIPPATFAAEFPKLIQLMESVQPRYGSYGVFGDTDLELYRIPLDQLESLVLLSSRSRFIETDGGNISIHGLSLYESKHGNWALRGINSWVRETSPYTFRVLIGHAPDFSLVVGDHAIDLCLAGHTHGGQVRIPFFGALVTDSKVPDAWSRGMTRIGNPLLNVSAGAGSNRFGGLPRLRFNCPTEITLIELIPSISIR